MLQAMRDGSKSIIIKAFFLLLLGGAVLGLAVMDLHGTFTNVIGNRTTLAKIGSEKITVPEFDRLYQQTLRQNNITTADAYAQGLHRQILRQEIDSRLLSRAANDMGLIVDDSVVANQVAELIKPYVDQGMAQDIALSSFLQRIGMSEPQLVASLKNQVATQSLLRFLSGGIVAPKQLIQDALKYKNEARRGEYLELTLSDIDQVPTPTDAELQAHYDKIMSRFMMPEYRSFSVLVFDRKALGIDEPAPPTLADVKDYYNNHVQEFTLPERRSVSQVIVSDMSVANAIYNTAKENGDLKKAAEEHGANVVKGKYGAKDLPQELSSVVFDQDAMVSNVFEPVQSPLGYHILSLDKINAPGVKAFDDVKGDIQERLAHQDTGLDELYERANDIDDMLAGGTQLSEIASEYNLNTIDFEKVDEKGLTTLGKEADTQKMAKFNKVLEEVFLLDIGEPSQLIETDDGAFIVATTTDIVPAAARPFDAVKDKVKQDWIAEQKSERFDAQAAKLMERISLGESFDKIAKELSKKTQFTDFIDRGSLYKKSNLPTGMTSALFAMESAGQAITVRGDDKMYILRLAERKIEMPNTVDEEDQKALQDVLSQSLQNDILEQYRQSLVREYNVSIDEALLDKVYEPKDEL